SSTGHSDVRPRGLRGTRGAGHSRAAHARPRRRHLAPPAWRGRGARRRPLWDLDRGADAVRRVPRRAEARRARRRSDHRRSGAARGCLRSGAVAPYVTMDGELVPGRELNHGSVREIGGYVIEARGTPAWEAIADLLAALGAEHPQYFHRLMRGCVRLSNGA